MHDPSRPRPWELTAIDARPSPQLPPEVRRRAMLTCAEHASGPEDLRCLLGTLGLTDDDWWV